MFSEEHMHRRDFVEVIAGAAIRDCPLLLTIKFAHRAQRIAACLLQNVFVRVEHVIIAGQQMILPPRRTQNGVEAERHRESEKRTFER